MSFKDARLNLNVLFLLILLLLFVVAVGTLILDGNEGGGGRPQETECKRDLAVVHYEGV